MHYFDDVSIPQFSTSKPIKTWTLAGYREFSLHYWFRGQPGSVVYLTLSFNNLQAAHRAITIDSGGIALAVEVFPVSAPEMSIVMYNPSAPMEGKIRVYAACCPDGEASDDAFKRKSPRGEA